MVVRVRNQTTWVPRNTQFLLDLDVRGAPPGATAVTTVYEAHGSRQAFDDAIDDPSTGGALDANLPAVALDQAPALEDGGRSAVIQFLVRDGGEATPGSVDINQFGVYPVEVVVRSADGRQLARLVTHLVRLPDPGQESKPVVSSLLLPFSAPPTLQTDGGDRLSDHDRTRLAAIADSLVLHPDVAVTVMPTPETLDGLHATGDPTDATTLQRLSDGTRNAQMLAEPYVRLDQSAWLASGLGAQFGAEQLVGAKVVGDRLGRLPSGSAQLVDRDLSAETFAHLQAGGTRNLIVPASALAPVDGGRNAPTPTRPFPVESAGTTLDAVQVDTRLQAAFTRYPDDPVLGAHELLAELATIFGDDPTALHGVVLLPPPTFNASTDFLDALLDGLRDGAPVVTPTSVDALFGLVPSTGRDDESNASDGRQTRRLANRPVPSLGSYPDRLRTAQGLLGSLQSLIGAGEGQTAVLSRQLLVSGSLDLTPAQRLQRLDIVNTIANRQLGMVEVPDNQTVTLASSTADIPLTIRNQLSQPVTLRIELQASRRLEFPDGKTFTTKPLAPQASTRISIRVRTRGSGVSPVQITVRTPDGRVLQSTRYRVQSTAVSGVGFIITIGAAAFLVLWWASHVYRDRRGRRRPAHRRAAR